MRRLLLSVLSLALMAGLLSAPVLAHHRPGHGGGGPPSATPTPLPTPTPVPTPTPPGGYLFSDDFNDLSQWAWDGQWGDHGLVGGGYAPSTSCNHGQAMTAEQATVSGGVLNMAVERQTTPDGSPFACSVLSTNGRFQFQYGTVEARVWYDTGTALWPAVWLLAPGTGARTEFDLMEAYPNPPGSGRYADQSGWPGPTRFDTTLHRPSLGFRDNRTISAGSDLTQGWHVFSMTWSPGQIVVQLDGATVTTFTQNIPAEPMYLVLDHVIGSYHAKIDEGVRSPDLALMRVDWLRVSP